MAAVTNPILHVLTNAIVVSVTLLVRYINPYRILRSIWLSSSIGSGVALLILTRGAFQLSLRLQRLSIYSHTRSVGPIHMAKRVVIRQGHVSAE